ncbi:amidohydrolase family protein [Methyloversatilis thermotolerans]|uniref:amidohydrolase family protein n=1 Tax=Methyloversatilis thermotolerans TaxID=1346290 RepID=UPI0003749546|nr:amidohydrolase family protein [Methyloversatilis thermotolerans]
MTTAPTTLLNVAKVFTSPGAEAPLGPQRLHLKQGRIAALEPLAHINGAAMHHVVLPAPSNAHDHGRGLRTLAFGARDQSLETWLPELAYEPQVDPYLRAAVAFARMAEGGIAAANHCHNTQDGRALLKEARGVARAARDVGVRIAFAVPFAGLNSVVYGDLDPLLQRLPHTDHARIRAQRVPTRSSDENFALVEAIAELEHEGFTVQYGPVGPQWVDDDTLARIAQASADSGRRVHMHLFETQRQRAWADARYPGGLLRHLDALGLLSPRLTVAHAVWLDADDCALLAERGVTLSANVSSNLRLRSGVAPWSHYLDSGVRFGFGLDGMSLDDDDDILRETRLAWHLLAASDRRGRFAHADLFRALCVDGRRSVLGDDGGGTLRVGAPADLLVLDTRRLTRDRIADDRPALLDLIIGRATRRDISQLVVAGRTVVDNGHCCSVDLPSLEAELIAQAKQAARDNPPDADAIGRLHAAVRAHYGCACTGHEDDR